ncbi:hypothetical protein IWQ52_004294 [Labrenzia sp. EL_159]|nr:hypothetical protein [Labrenzia sp. EL_162]MBG6196758.1 hypothetical protein [Labrenzia sp. EL_159]
MTEITDDNVHFDVRQSVRGRNIARLIIAPLISFGLIGFGTWLLPEGTVLELHIEAVETWNVWSFLGFICIGGGIYCLLKEAVFAARAYSTTGEWHFRLTDRDLLWHVPNHAHGKEEGFEAPLEEIKQIEFRTIQKHEDIDKREYWIHFHSRDSVKLQSYSGISLSWLVEKISATGVPYEETSENF